MSEPWRLWIDTGGTFTDCRACDPEGRRREIKVLSSSALRGRIVAVPAPNTVLPDLDLPCEGFARGLTFHVLGAVDPPRTVVASGRDLRLDAAAGPAARPGAVFELRSGEPAPILAARLVTGTPAGAALPAVELRLATTRGTNTLLQRSGAPTALFITEGFGDLLRIGDQQRPDLFRLRIDRPSPLTDLVVEVPERLAADGTVLRELDEGAIAARARALVAEGVRSAAVALMHSYRNPVHEHTVTDILRREGFRHVTASAERVPLIKLVPRATTAVVDAYLGPIVATYLDEVASALPTRAIHVMTSAGGLVQARAYAASDSLLSGPAGGVTGAAAVGRRAGFSRIIGFDMGGTSTDVARYEGDHEYRFEHSVAGVTVSAPALAIETVAAGGGSVCTFADGRLRVGPMSAGADPGPACYGAGGPLTLTDVNLLLGRLDADRFGIPLFAGASAEALAALAALVAAETEAPDNDGLLEGLLEIADERMADAIRGVSLRRGFDPADHALVAFGGAGGQHACAVAERLRMDTVLMPPDASVLSAAGLEAAVVERFAHRQVLRPLVDVQDDLVGWMEALAARARADVEAEGTAPDEIVVRRRIVELRLVGQEATIAVDGATLDATALLRAFGEQHARLYGYAPAGRPVEVESLRVVASVRPPADAPVAPMHERGNAPVRRTTRARFDGQ